MSPGLAVVSPRSPVSRTLDVHVTATLGFIAPYMLPVFAELSKRVRRLSLMISTPMEADRRWQPDFGDLEVHLQRNWTVRKSARDPAGYAHEGQIYVPWNSLALLRRLRPDCIVSSGLGFRSAMCTLHQKLAQRPAVAYWAAMSEHSERKWSPLRHGLRRRLLPHANACAYNGQSGKRYLERLGYPAERLFHVPYVAIPDLYDRCALHRDPAVAHRLLYVGRLLDWKGLLPFVAALSRFAAAHPERGVELSIAGSGPLERALRDFRTPANLRVSMLGERRPRELAQTYLEHGILAFPTFDDEWGLVVNEAMAAGLPVLGSRYSQAVEELCVEGCTGWVFSPDDEASMAAAIGRALGTATQDVERMRESCRRQVEDRTPAAAVDGLIECIAAAIDHRRKRGGKDCP